MIEKPNSKYWLTPPDIYAALNSEFQFTFDPCPYPKPEGFNGLLMDWGASNYVNPHKAIEEQQKGRSSVIVIPVQSYVNLLLEAGAELRSMGRVRWLDVYTKEPCKSPSPICGFILKGK